MLKKLLVLLSCFYATHLMAQEEFTIIFGSKGYPPFYVEDLESGMYIDFIQEFQRQHPEYDVQLKALPRKRMDQWMESGRADAFSLNSPIFVDEAVRDNFLFSDPIWHTGDHVVFLKEHKFKYEKPEDLFDKRIGIVLGNGYGELDPYLESGQIETQAVKAGDQLHLILKYGRVDAIFGNRHVTPYQMKGLGLDPNTVAFSEVALFEFDLVTMIQKDKQVFLKKYNTFIAAAKQNGLLNDIANKYLGQDYKPAQ